MIKEQYILKNKEINLSISGGEISSVIKKDITQSACRVYDQGFIGVAGKLGEADSELMEQAAENLKLQIPYEAQATEGKVRREDWAAQAMDGESPAAENPGAPTPAAQNSSTESPTVENPQSFLREVQEVLEILKKEYPQLIFGNKVRLSQLSRHLCNDAGTDLFSSDRLISWELLIKHTQSVNVFDDFLACAVRNLNRQAFLKEAREHLDAFLNPVSLPDPVLLQDASPKGRLLPVILSPMALGGFLTENLDALSFGHGTSFFNGKLGQKLFNEKFSFCVDRSSKALCTAFFDAEGSTCENDRNYLIKDGVLLKPFADKKLAKEFGYENTATAGGAYDSVPSNTDTCFSVESSGQTLRELIGERDGIYISVMSGGDFTSEGNFASPVQTAFLYRGGKLLGRLPEFHISGNIYDIFGANFVGASSDRAYDGEFKLVVNMKVG